MSGITITEAVKAIEDKLQSDALWIAKAMTLFDLISSPHADLGKLRDVCKAHSAAYGQSATKTPRASTRRR